MTPILRRTLALVLFAFAAFSTAYCQDTDLTFPTNEQMRHYKAMGEPQLSPDGQHVLIRITDATADGGKSHLWLVDVNGGAARQLTYSPDSDKRGERNGQWMPDGQSVLFLAKRGEHTMLYRLPMNGGEAKATVLKVTPKVDQSKREDALPPVIEAKKEAEKIEPVAIDVSNYRISPDGKTIAVIARDPQTPGEKKQKDAKADAAWVDHGLHGDRLYFFDVATERVTETGVPVDVRNAAWNADSTKLVVTSEEPNGVAELGPANRAWIILVNDALHPTRVTELPPTAGQAAWSHDGNEIFYLGQAKRDAPPGYADLYQYTLATKAVRNLSDGFEGSLGRGELIATRDGGVLVASEHGVESKLTRFSEGKAEPVKLPVATIAGTGTNRSQSGWVFIGSSGGKEPTLFYSASLDVAPRVLTTPALAPKGVKTVTPKRISWKSDGSTIDGLLYMPPQGATGKVPLVVEVHGGPLGAYVDSYQPFVDFLVGQGWAVLRTNPRGSTGRGTEFAAANKNDLGGGDYRDIMAGVDYVLKTEPVDEARMALMGYSYGGEMAAFVETKTARFKAIVSAAPVIDQNSEYGTERGSWYDQWYYGKPWEHEADAWRQSPISGVAQAKTPFMLLQGEDDSTDPLGQSLEMYHALRQMHVPVDLVTYPRVDHGPLGGAIYGSPSDEPWHGFDARQRIVSFFTKEFAKGR
ncbi:MAG TPA: S9 family peptidase [Edaphobacter sp.]|jgi:dipeptidyl aminopeptidase/acylaminoacyl peptidase|nr:S9 family peptidase [Edaphobacter sp.]